MACFEGMHSTETGGEESHGATSSYRFTWKMTVKTVCMHEKVCHVGQAKAGMAHSDCR